MSRCRIGTTVIDALKLCYMVNVEDLSALTGLGYGEWETMGDFSFFRVASQHFAYSYNILHSSDEERHEVAQLRFARYGEQQTDNIYAFLHIANSVLYDHSTLEQVLMLPEEMGMVFHNITTIDLAKDFTTINPVSLIRRLYKDKCITTIINGKAVKDRKETVAGFSQTYSVSLARLKNPTISIKQVKALHNKNKGITVCAYNKATEIDVSGKEYILNYYGRPKKLHRLEVHLNSQEVSDYFRGIGEVQDLSLIADAGMLDAMFYYHLSAVIRFSRGRHPLSWSDLLNCTGRAR